MFFLQTHADACLGLGLSLGQFVVLKITGAPSYPKMNTTIDEFLDTMWKYVIITGLQTLVWTRHHYKTNN